MMNPLKFQVTDELRVRLDQAVARSGKGLGEEIRDRLMATFAEEELAAPTVELRRACISLGELVKIDCGSDWSISPVAHVEFTAAMSQRLANYGPPTPDRTVATISDMFAPADPVMLGRIREQDDSRWNSKLYPCLAEALRLRTARMLRSVKQGGEES
jgi:hypothetical protein